MVKTISSPMAEIALRNNSSVIGSDDIVTNFHSDASSDHRCAFVATASTLWHDASANRVQRFTLHASTNPPPAASNRPNQLRGNARNQLRSNHGRPNAAGG